MNGMPRWVALALLAGCTIRTHSVELARVATGRSSTPEQRDEAPVATRVETDGRVWAVDAEEPRSCRTQVHKRERVTTRVEPREKPKFWAQAIVAGAATTTAAITVTQAEWWTTAGRKNFGVFLVAAPVAWGFGKPTVQALGKMKGSKKTRTHTALVDAGSWTACGAAPFDGGAGLVVRPPGVEMDPLHSTFTAGRSIDFDILTVPSKGWQQPRWDIQLLPDAAPVLTASSRSPQSMADVLKDARARGLSGDELVAVLRQAKEDARAPDPKAPPADPPTVTVPVEGSRFAAMEAVHHEEQAMERARELAAAKRRHYRENTRHGKFESCYRNGAHNLLRNFGCLVGFYSGVAKDVSDALPDPVKAKLWEFAAEVWANSQSTAGQLYSSPGARSSGQVEVQVAPPGAPQQVAHPSQPERTSSYYVAGVLLYPSGQPCRECGISLASENGVSSEKAYTNSRGEFTLTMRGRRVQKLYSDGWEIWSGNQSCYQGCYLKVYRR